MEELYKLIGMVMRNAQAIERNLSLIIYFEKILSVFENSDEVPDNVYFDNHDSADGLFEWMSGVPMGEIVKLARKTQSMNKKLISNLERVLKYRNYVAHEIFKSKEFLVGGKLTQRKLTSFVNIARNELEFSANLNDVLLKISDDLIERYDRIT